MGLNVSIRSWRTDAAAVYGVDNSVHIFVV
jgi:hypothetical protein